MQPNLREWLLPLRKHKGKVTPGENFRLLFEQARAAAGIVEWPENALRHGFASFHLAHFRDAKALALELGHTNEDMIFSNYRQLVEPKAAERYWSLAPRARTFRRLSTSRLRPENSSFKTISDWLLGLEVMLEENKMMEIRIDYTEAEFAAVEASAAAEGLSVEDFHRAVTREVAAAK